MIFPKRELGILRYVYRERKLGQFIPVIKIDRIICRLLILMNIIKKNCRIKKIILKLVLRNFYINNNFRIVEISFNSFNNLNDTSIHSKKRQNFNNRNKRNINKIQENL